MTKIPSWRNLSKASQKTVSKRIPFSPWMPKGYTVVDVVAIIPNSRRVIGLDHLLISALIRPSRIKMGNPFFYFFVSLLIRLLRLLCVCVFNKSGLQSSDRAAAFSSIQQLSLLHNLLLNPLLSNHSRSNQQRTDGISCSDRQAT